MLAGFGIFLAVVNQHYPVRLWLVWDYVKYWAYTLTFTLACFLPGYAVVRKVLPRGVRLRERLVLAMAAGVLLFFFGLYVAGLLKLYGSGLFVAWPALLISAGVVLTRRELDHVSALWRRARRLPFRRWSTLEQLIFAAGVIALFIIYAQVFVPENSNYDSKWYHIPIGEHYVAVGGIEPFVEGWYHGALPHLTSFLYAWALMQPTGPFVDKLMVCAHLEFVLFLWTVFAVPVLVRWLVPSSRPHLAWVAFFLFPGIFLYDSSLGMAADHVAAFWAIPLFLALVRFWPRLDPRWGVMLGMMLGAAMLTKYQSASLVMFPILAVVVRCAWLTLRAPAGARLVPFRNAAIAGGLMIALFSAHWAKNWVFYGDPAYPWLHKYFTAKQWTPDTLPRMEFIYDEHLWTPKGDTFAQRVLVTLKAVGTFSLVPNDWYALHRDVPVFGSLFTLLFFALIFLRGTRRLWAVFAAANLGVFVWYWQTHQDRYLQLLVPWMACFTAGTLILAWRQGLLVRGAVSLLVGLQVVWGSDVPFIGTHRQIGDSPLKVAVDRMASGFNKKFDARLNVNSSLVAVGEALPRDARVLMHEEEQHMGLMRPVVSDWSEWQGGLSYGRFKSPAEVHDRFVEYGITHIVQIPERSRDSDFIPGDLVYYDYVTHFALPWKTIPPWKVMLLAPTRPPETPYRPMLWLGCENLHDVGVYAYEAMMKPWRKNPPKESMGKPLSRVDGKDLAAVEKALDEVDGVAHDARCVSQVPPSLGAKFVKVARRGPLDLWIRRR